MTATTPTDIDTAPLDTEREWRQFDDRDERRDTIARDLTGVLETASL